MYFYECTWIGTWTNQYTIEMDYNYYYHAQSAYFNRTLTEPGALFDVTSASCWILIRQMYMYIVCL